MAKVEEKTIRSVFVGNIPYEATEEQLKEIFQQVGPVSSFRIVYDRETGKPKGYGFCEYTDVETAESAMRNLNDFDFHGRALRVGHAAGEQSNAEKIQSLSVQGPPEENMYGPETEPAKAPEAISKAVASLPPEQMFELMKQMKLCIQNNPNEARNMLLQNPQLAYALLQAQIVMKIVDPQVALAMLHRQSEEIPPLMPSGNAAPASNAAAAVKPDPGLLPLPLQSPTLNQAPPRQAAPMEIDIRPPPQSNLSGLVGLPLASNGPPLSVVSNIPGPPRGGLLGDRPPGEPLGGYDNRLPPSRPGPEHPPFMDRQEDMRMRDERDRYDAPPQDRYGGPPHGARGPGAPPHGAPPRGYDGSPHGGRGPPPGGFGGPQDRFGGPPHGGPAGPGAPGGRDPRDDMRGPPRPDPRDDPRGGPRGDMRGDPRDPRGQRMPLLNMGGPRQGGPPLGGPRPQGGPGGPPPRPQAGPPPRPAAPAAGANVSSQDQEKAALIMQVLQLSDDQIAMLPAEQRQSILILKDQIARSTAGT